MLWYLPWSENIKKRACRYLLQRYLGNFLEEKLTLDQLSVDLYNGTGTVCDVSLDCEALNELGDSQNWPLEIVDGYMQEITVTIPWSTLLKDDSVVEVNGLSFTVQPKVRPEPGEVDEPASSMLESMWSSMSSSMQLAAECLRQEDGPPETHPVEGIEMFAHAIDSILSRVKVRFVNTKIRIEHVPKNSDRGIALVINIKNIEYYDEAGTEPPPDVTDPEKAKTYIVSTYTNKKIMFDGVTLYTDEFPSKLRTMARSLIMEKSVASDKTPEASQIDVDLNFQSTSSDIFYETRSVLSEPEQSKNDEPIRSENVTRREVTPEERANQPEPILFAKLTGRQELALKIKHSEEAIGPKVDLQMTLGSLIVFLTPRQLHTLLEIVDGLNQPHLEDTSNIPLRPSGATQCKPMRQADFQMIEAQLMGNFTKEIIKPNISSYGWTGQNLDDSDSEERFQPMAGTGTGGGRMSDSCSSASSMTASVSSSVHLPVKRRERKVPQIDGDPTAEVSHINIRIASCSCILLHKDILVPIPLGIDCVTATSAKKMQEASAEFFERLGLFSIGGHGRRDFDYANETFDKATQRNHLRLILSSIAIEGSEKTTSHGSQTVLEASAARMLVRERLASGEGCDLLRFMAQDDDGNDSDTASTAAPQPCIRVHFRQTLKYMRISGEKKLLYPTTDITVKCQPFLIDVDLTLLDRMSGSLLGPPPAPAPAPAPAAQNQLNITVSVSNMDLILRFPIADLRPGIAREVRRVRQDYLLLSFQEVLVSSNQAPGARPLPTTVSLRATILDLYYHENENSQGIHIARSSVGDLYDTNILKTTTAALPSISLTFQPSKTAKGPFDPLSDEETSYEPAANPMTTSMYIMDKLRDKAAPSPFSSKKTAHQSVTKHEDSPHGQAEELIVPGSAEEMAEFTNHCVEQSAIHLELNLPVLSLQLESKQMYEIIYNRINSDLLLWEPAPAAQCEIRPLAARAPAPEPNIYPAFGMCKNAGYDSDTASSSSDDDNLYYSTYDSRMKKKMAAKPVAEKKSTHNFCFTMKVSKGLLTIYTPVRDSNKRVVPGQMGELVLDVTKLWMCQVSGLHGRAKTAQLCLRATNVTLYHDSLLTIPSEKPPLRMYGDALPLHLKETIYPSGKGVMLKEHGKKDMFSLALNVEPQMDLPNFKKICLALGIELGTLRYRGGAGGGGAAGGGGVAWLHQLLDVLDVADYPVPGYRPSSVLTELHVHVWNCAVDYRPLYLPIRTVVTLGSFSVSSNVLAQTNTSSLRFLAQDCALFLSHLQCKSSAAVPQDDKPPDVVRDYVCVCDVGLLELSLRCADKASTNGPHVDLSASNNIVNIHTCWDSASALCRLVTYLAADGDSAPPCDVITDAANTQRASFSSDRLETLVGLEDHPEDIRELSPSEIQQVNDLMAEAMKESPNTTLDEEDINSSTEKEGVEIFFFPDESTQKPRTSQDLEAEFKPDESLEFDDAYIASPDVEECRTQNAQVARELGDPSASPRGSPQKPARTKKRSTGEGGNTDDEYCIIDCPPPCEDDDLAEPLVTWFGAEPAPLLDNHFTVPAAKSDVLKAPKNFPVPSLRYTLCEMSIVWHLFGGHDFHCPTDSPAPKPKNVTINEPELPGSPGARCSIEYEPYESSRPSGVSYRTGTRRLSGSEKGKDKDVHWKTRGGVNRDKRTGVQISLSKIKFQHETYPSGGTHASRQTLAISKVEVLDRLSNSHINKFLSQYALKDEPERKNAHMLVIKAVHLRPDPTLAAQECCLKVSLLPLRFNVDQDTLAFLVGFFSKLGTDEPPEDDDKSLSGASLESGGSRQTTPTHRPPVMSVARPAPPDRTSLHDTSVHEDEPLMESYEAERLVSENLIQLEEDFQLRLERQKTTSATVTPDLDVADDSPLYFRRVVFAPDVPIRLDYVGKRVDLSAGPVAGLLMGLGQLNCSELRLKRLYHRHGLLGFERLLKWALQEWLADIKRHQLPGLLSGIGPMHSLLQFVRGIRDLLWLPVEQWRRDGRLVHGLRRGAASFTARTAVAALDITQRILHVIQATAETAFDMLTPGPTLQLQETFSRRARRRRRRQDPARHPADIREGVASAYMLVKEGFAETAATMAIAARSGRGAGVLRHLPGAAVTPLALAAAGAADVLGGARASLQPAARRDLADKYRPRPDSPSE